jgi:hypothetical protein
VPKIEMSAEEIFARSIDFRSRCTRIDEKIACMGPGDDEYKDMLRGTKITFMMVARALEAVLGIPLDPDEMA